VTDSIYIVFTHASADKMKGKVVRENAMRGLARCIKERRANPAAAAP
jgi:hypothetical protein